MLVKQFTDELNGVNSGQNYGKGGRKALPDSQIENAVLTFLLNRLKWLSAPRAESVARRRLIHVHR
jgi:hypothetical protein